MNRLVGISTALVVALGILAGNLWLQLRDARREIAELRAQASQPDLRALPSLSTQGGAPQVSATVGIPEKQDLAAPPASAITAAVAEPPPPPPAVVISPPAMIQAPVITETIRTNAYLQSDQTATARVVMWRDRLAIAGHSLTTEQLQTLNKVATAELRRETEETLELASTLQATDLESSLRIREETLNRQHQTNMRILAGMTPHLNADQAKALQTQFETGHATRMAGLRSDAELMRQQQR
jgi:hypothetical protein